MDCSFPTEFLDCSKYIDAVEFNDKSKENNNFHIFHQNIRSFAKNYDEFSVFISNLSTDIDVLIFTETWFTASSTCDITGYVGVSCYWGRINFCEIEFI